MTNATKLAFGSEYLDTTHNRSAAIRHLFKDWEKQVFDQEFKKKLDEKTHIALYKKHIARVVNESVDAFK